MSIPVYLLAGGKSRRFGSDKARAALRGKPLMMHVAESLSVAASRVTVVADVAGKYDDLGFRTIGDVVPGAGPMGGLLTALRDCDEPWLLLAPCDFVGIQQGWIEHLLEETRDGFEAVVFRGDRWQPMPGLYHASLADRIERQLQSAQRSMTFLLDHADVRVCPLPRDWPAHAGINTTDELDRHRAR